MKPLAFFREMPVVRLLERGARSAAMPVSVHYAAEARNAMRVASFGQCACCKQVATLPGGVATCRASRVPALTQALAQSTSVPFLCHMGLACIVTPIPFAPGFTLTWGPFCPSEEPRALETEVKAGLAALTDEPVDSLPFALSDIHIVPAGAVTSIIEWTLEQLTSTWQAQSQEEATPDETPVSTAPEPEVPSHSSRTIHDPYLGSALAAAMAAGNQSLIRQHLTSILADTPKRTLESSRTRLIATVMAALEAAEVAALDTRSLHKRLPDFVTVTQTLHSEKELITTALSLLGSITRKKHSAPPAGSRKGFRATQKTDPESPHAQFNQILWDHLTEGITLNEVAARIGQKPSAITHRLQRKYGMSFSDYYGRLRVEKAKELLRRTRLTVTEIGRRVGIDDVSNFGKLFRKFEGKSPLAYRTSAKNKKNRQKTL